jgi:hypothetical protein
MRIDNKLLIICGIACSKIPQRIKHAIPMRWASLLVNHGSIVSHTATPKTKDTTTAILFGKYLITKPLGQNVLRRVTESTSARTHGLF